MRQHEVQTVDDCNRSAHFLMEHEGEELLKEFGLPVIQGALARDNASAVTIAENIGYPIVLKGMSRDIVHKTEANVVKLNIRSKDELIRAYDAIIANAAQYDKDAHLEGVLVQKMAPAGLELIIGIKKDPVFGHQLIIGMGGTLVEIMQDFSMRMMPVTNDEVDEMVRELQGYPLLNGYRGAPKINMRLLYDIVSGLNRLVAVKPEIEELDLNPIIFSEEKAMICDVRLLLAETETGDTSPLRPLSHVEKMINPQSIAVVGASTNEEKSGGRLFRYIMENGFAGKLYPIHPKAREIRGIRAYASLRDVPEPIDLACIIVAAKLVPSILEDCIAKGIKSAIIYSSGFSEVGEEGKRLQEKIVSLAQEGNIRLLGPNSIGIASPSKNIYTAFGAALEARKKCSGNIGFISQSGAMGSALLSRAWEQGAGFSRWISVANEADLTISDFINVLADDELTKVISVFMESVKDANAFKSATQKALKRQKPVLVYKTGRSSVGQRAVQSHTGLIAGDDAVYSAAFEKFGVLRVKRIEELIDVSRSFGVQPIPKGNKIGVITASGGACSVIADLCDESGLAVPVLSETAAAIEEVIPPFGSAQNPIDVTAEIIGKPEMFKKVLQKVINDRTVDGVIVMLTTNADPGATVIAQAILDTFKSHEKPIVVGRLGADMIAPQAMALYEKENFPIYPTPERVVSVMRYLVEYNTFLKKKV